jgi:hypothetical protein
MTLHAAVVHSRDGIRLLTASASAEQTLDAVAQYVLRHADHMLWPVDARQVAGLLAIGRLRAGVDLYFDRVGERWDREFLHEAQLRQTGPADVPSGIENDPGSGH